MLRLIGFEIEKIFQKKIVWACILGIALMAALMTANWIFPAYNQVQYPQGEEIVQVEGMESIALSREIAARWEGPLSDEKVRDILETYKWPEEALAGEGLDASIQAFYVRNFLYSSLSEAFAKNDGTWNGAKVSDVYPAGPQNLNVGYTAGWTGFLYAAVYTMLSLGCVLVIIAAPLFSEEYARGTDALILTGRYGKTKCAAAKVAAAYIVTLGLAFLVIASQFLCFLAVHGTAGWDASVQINEKWMFTDVPYRLTCLEASLFGFLMWLAGTVVVTGITILISALAPNSFAGLIIAFTIYTAPMFVSWEKIPFIGVFGNFFPINQAQLAGIFAVDKIKIGGARINFMWLAVPVALAVFAAAAAGARRAFARHQVTG